MSIWSAIGLSVIATCCYQVGMVMQKIGADRMPRLELTLRQREVFGAFLRSPIWLGGMGVTIAGWLFFLAAIANAPVSIVQPVLGFGLCLLALFSVVFLKERLLPLEWTGVALMVAGIVLLGISGSRDAGGRGVVSSAALLGVSVALLALLALAIPLGRSGRGASLPVLLGFAAGVLIGLAALYTKGLFLSLESGLPWFAWLVFLPLVLAANIGGIWVQQAGFQHGRALIVVAMNAVTNKVVTIIGGMMTLGELLPGDANLAAARLAGFVTILAGTAILTRFGGAEIGQATRAPVRALCRHDAVGGCLLHSVGGSCGSEDTPRQILSRWASVGVGDLGRRPRDETLALIGPPIGRCPLASHDRRRRPTQPPYGHTLENGCGGEGLQANA